MVEQSVRIGVIGGSGVYNLEALQDVQEVRLTTPFGAPSGAYIIGTLHKVRVAFLARHGRGHIISPTELNSRANIWGFKMLGVEYLISSSACGSLREGIHPGDIVIPDQLFDRTRNRPLTFFGEGIVVHIGMAEPFCPYLSSVLYRATSATGQKVHRGGNFVVIEGPRFSTKAESQVFRQWGMDIIGMTAIPEANLAREAEMSYATIAHVTDYDVWHETEEPVTVEMIVQTLMRNAEVVKAAIVNAVVMLADAPPSPQKDALRDAIVTAPEKIPPQTRKKLALLLNKYVS